MSYKNNLFAIVLGMVAIISLSAAVSQSPGQSTTITLQVVEDVMISSVELFTQEEDNFTIGGSAYDPYIGLGFDPNIPDTVGIIQYDAALKFDLSDIPAGVTIESAELAIPLLFNASFFDYKIYQVSKSWSEASLDGEFESLDQDIFNQSDPFVFGSIGFGLNGAFQTADVTTLAQNWVSGAENNGFLLVPEPDSLRWFASIIARENTEYDVMPELRITYTDEPAPTLTPVVTPTQTTTTTPTPIETIPTLFSLEGKIVNNANARTIPDALITINDNIALRTDGEGKFQTDLPSGFHIIKISHPDYIEFEQEILVSSNSNKTFRIIHKPVIVLVHGFSGTTVNNMDCEPNDVSDGPERITQFRTVQQIYSEYMNRENKEIKTTFDPELFGHHFSVAYWADLPFWFENEYDLWVAQYTTTSDPSKGTPRIQQNAKCLSNQINYVSEITGNQEIIVIAHSMGGLVSRACLKEDSTCEANVSKLITLGSPHRGIDNVRLASPLLINCISEPGACQMAPGKMRWFNFWNPNLSANKVDYLFIGGGAEISGKINFKNSEGKLCTFLLESSDEPHDCLVSQYSAVGLTNNNLTPLFWDETSKPALFLTDEYHGQIYSDNRVYFLNRDQSETQSHTYQCIQFWLNGGEDPGVCQHGGPLVPLNKVAPIRDTQLDNPNIVNSPLVETTILPGLTDQLEIEIQAEGDIRIDTTWDTGDVIVTLTDPNGQQITPDLAKQNQNVDFIEQFDLLDRKIGGSYLISNGPSGQWIINLEASSDNIPVVKVTSVAFYESAFSLKMNADMPIIASSGDKIRLSTELNYAGQSESDQMVTAQIRLPNGQSESITLKEQEKGVYAVNFTIPEDTLGFIDIEFLSNGTRLIDGEARLFSLSSQWSIEVLNPQLSLPINFSERAINRDDDDRYEALEMTFDIETETADAYEFVAILRAGESQIMAETLGLTLAAGKQKITLSFDGKTINASQQSGPYRLDSLIISRVGEDQPERVLEDLMVTKPYAYSEFGSGIKEIYAPLIRH